MFFITAGFAVATASHPVFTSELMETHVDDTCRRHELGTTFALRFWPGEPGYPHTPLTHSTLSTRLGLFGSRFGYYHNPTPSNRLFHRLPLCFHTG
jgi:hypothetical protein